MSVVPVFGSFSSLRLFFSGFVINKISALASNSWDSMTECAPKYGCSRSGRAKAGVEAPPHCSAEDLSQPPCFAVVAPNSGLAPAVAPPPSSLTAVVQGGRTTFSAEQGGLNMAAVVAALPRGPGPSKSGCFRNHTLKGLCHVHY